MSSGDYDNLLDVARNDTRVVGLVLTGSRGAGAFVRPESDWDVRLVVRDDALAESEAAFATAHGSPVEVVVLSLTDFEGAGAIGSPSEWDRYSYTRVEVVLDKLEGRINELVAEKSVLPPEAARQIAARALDTYINSYYRSAKNLRGGLILEAQLDAAESISPLLDALFAFEGRVRPFNRFLGWELERFPFKGDLWSTDRLLPRLRAIITSGDLGDQQSMFRDVEQLARGRGFGTIVDGWEPDVMWLRGEVAPSG